MPLMRHMPVGSYRNLNPKYSFKSSAKSVCRLDLRLSVLSGGKHFAFQPLKAENLIFSAIFPVNHALSLWLAERTFAKTTIFRAFFKTGTETCTETGTETRG